jgi:hypothetical protein
MLETVLMIETYLLGFATVWLAILAVCCVKGVVGRRRHNWDRAVARELLVAPARSEARRELPTRTPGPSTTE